MSTILKNLTWVALTILLALLIRVYVMAIYLVPTPSMEPNIMSQDIILAIKPFALKESNPKRDEIWLFKKIPDNLQTNPIMVKRLCGIPGDTIQFHEGSLVVNGISINAILLRGDIISAGTLPYPSPLIFPNDTSLIQWSALDFGPLWIPKKGVTIILNKLNLLLYRKYILNESPSLIQTPNGDIAHGERILAKYTFKQNYFFACGDNLALSNDSRHWGLIPACNLMSKAKLVLFSIKRPFSNYKRLLRPIN